MTTIRLITELDTNTSTDNNIFHNHVMASIKPLSETEKTITHYQSKIDVHIKRIETIEAELKALEGVISEPTFKNRKNKLIAHLDKIIAMSEFIINNNHGFLKNKTISYISDIAENAKIQKDQLNKNKNEDDKRQTLLGIIANFINIIN